MLRKMAKDGKENPFREVPAEKLRWRCDPGEFDFATTEEVTPLDEIIGQDRATDAIRLGLDVSAPGYNIFVAGFVGTGRNTTIRRFLEEARKGTSASEDLAYVHNFPDPDRPRLLRFPAGRGCEFRREFLRFVAALKKQIPRILESEAFARERKQVLDGFDALQKQMVRQLEKRLEKERFALVQVEMGPIIRPEIAPILDGKPATLDEMEKRVASGDMEKKEFEALTKRREELSEELQGTIKKARQISRERQERLAELERQAVRPEIHEPIEEIASSYTQPGVRTFLEQVEEDLLSKLGVFHREGPPMPGLPVEPPGEDPFVVYEVNVIVDNGQTPGAPVIMENFPTFRNLFGTIEQEFSPAEGASRSNFTRIKAGSLIRANGGHLVLTANDVLAESGVWTMLKRVLRTGITEVQSHDGAVLMSTTAIKPEPIEVDVKVVMIGSHAMYHLLYNLDNDFRKIFKVKADFDVEMSNDDVGRQAYARFIRRLGSEEGLPPFDPSGVAAVVEQGARLAERMDRLTTRFNDLSDIVRESCYWAGRENSDVVREAHVERAVSERTRRVNLVEDKIQDNLERGLLLVDTEGEVVGQLNGLSLYRIGDHTFGRPTRITAAIGMGRRGIVNIERESRLSGPTHDKGVLILTGLLRERFARDKPLTLSASLCFEQSYSGVDGDSASSSEVYALVSALSDLPLRQDLAVTGSVNQKGEIQPIGGVNQKIEGFWETCRGRGFTGRQGVVIPARNLSDLMLRKEVVEAVEKGRFHIWAIDTIEQGVELLTGRPAGARQTDGGYPTDTVFSIVDARLRQLAEGIRPFGPADLL